jgi:hypothetical protein
LLLQQKIKTEEGFKLKSVFNMDSDTKSRFMRLLDLSLRAPSLPSKLIASFMKRIAREILSGNIWSTNDVLFGLSLIANLAKRHPRTVRLLTRNKNSLSLGITLDQDPYEAQVADPLMTKALKSSLWEVQVVLK